LANASLLPSPFPTPSGNKELPHQVPFPATRQSAIFSQSLQPCQAFRLDSSSACDARLCGGIAGKTSFVWSGSIGHEAACQVSSGRKCVAFPVAVHLIFRSAPILFLSPPSLILKGL